MYYSTDNQYFHDNGTVHVMSLDVNLSEPDEFNCNELHSILKTVSEIKCLQDFSYHVDFLSGKGGNYISNVFRVYLKDTTNPDNNISVIVKTLINTERQELFHALHKREVLAYTDVIDEFKDLQNDLDTQDRIILPVCITSSAEKGNEVIILEDLLLNGFEVETAKLDLNQVCLITSEIAKFHALSFVFEKHNSPKFEEVRKKFYDLIFQESFICKSKVKNYFIESYEMALNVITDIEAKEKLEQIKSKLFEILKLYTQPKQFNVFCHGDCWINNILFNVEESRTAVCFLDFQAMRYANPVTDIIYFLYICTDSQFRSEHTEHIKTVYYSSLKSFLELFNIDVNIVYPIKEFESDMNEFMIFGLLIALLEMRIVTNLHEEETILDAAEFEELSNCEVRSEETIFSIRVNDIVNEAVSNGTLDKLCQYCT